MTIDPVLRLWLKCQRNIKHIYLSGILFFRKCRRGICSLYNAIYTQKQYCVRYCRRYNKIFVMEVGQAFVNISHLDILRVLIDPLSCLYSNFYKDLTLFIHSERKSSFHACPLSCIIIDESSYVSSLWI